MKRFFSGRRWESARPIMRILGRCLAVVVTAAMLFAAVLVVLQRDKLTLDPLRRWVIYGSLKREEDGRCDEFRFAGDRRSSVASIDGGLMMCSSNALQVFSDGGELLVDMNVSIKNAVIHVDGSSAVAYDVGGSELYQFSGTEKVFSYTAAGQIISARVNASGYLAIVEQVGGHEVATTVYDNLHRPMIRVNEAENFVTDAVLAENNHYVALLEVYQDISEVSTNLVIYRLSDAHVSSTCKLEGEMVLDLRWDKDRIWLQRESGVTVCDSEGEILGGWNDKGRYLEAYSLSGAGYAVQQLSRYKSGSIGDLRIIDQEGQQSVSRRINEEVLSVSAAGGYIAVLTTSSVTIYLENLQQYAKVAAHGAKQVVMREDGSVFLIGSNTARLFLP